MSMDMPWLNSCQIYMLTGVNINEFCICIKHRCYHNENENSKDKGIQLSLSNKGLIEWTIQWKISVLLC